MLTCRWVWAPQVGGFEGTEEQLELGELRGNHFRITLRNLVRRNWMKQCHFLVCIGGHLHFPAVHKNLALITLLMALVATGAFSEAI